MLDVPVVVRYSNYINSKEHSMQIRTEAGSPVQHSSGKWSSTFNTYMGEVGAEFLANTVTSAPVWETEDAAYHAGTRALIILEQTDRFPNMCQPW